MDKRMKALSAGVAEAERSKSLSKQNPWVQMFGNPLIGE
jgi:hypothetical protein